MATSNKIINIKFTEYDSAADLPAEDKQLYDKARAANRKAYAPYSNFYVGAAVLLENGQIITGSNQENAAYPSGLCAERVALFYAGAQFPDVAVKTLVIACNSKDKTVNKPLSPCGACRQVISEYEQKHGKKIKIIMGGETGPLLSCEGIETLLPLMFKGEFVK